MTPTIGRVVQYRYRADQWAPAFVTAVHSDGDVSLTIFPSPHDGDDAVLRQTRVPQGEDLYEWRWPPRAD